jgi:glycosyltransferase involved in cell wall biosynthesis
VAEKENFVLSAGRLWDEGKNLQALDEAAVRLSIPVYVAGDCRHPEGRIIRPQAAHALGALSPDRLAERMARAAIYAAPARYEPFGLSILEAAASGCALVLGDIPSLRELWDDAAVFVPPDDAEALADAITGLMNDRGLRARQGAAAKDRSRHFSAAHMGWRYLQLYRELIADREAPLGWRAAG